MQLLATSFSESYIPVLHGIWITLKRVVFRSLRKIAKKCLLASSCLSVRPSVRMEQFGSYGTDFIKVDIWLFFKNLTRKFKFRQNLTRIMGTWHEDQHTFVISRSVLLRMRNVAEKVVHKIKPHILFWIMCPPPENLAVYEIMWKKCCRAGQTTDDEYGACALHAGYLRLQSLSLCVIILVTFPL
jgi:hypothetical protein